MYGGAACCNAPPGILFWYGHGEGLPTVELGGLGSANKLNLTSRYVDARRLNTEATTAGKKDVCGPIVWPALIASRKVRHLCAPPIPTGVCVPWKLWDDNRLVVRVMVWCCWECWVDILQPSVVNMHPAAIEASSHQFFLALRATIDYDSTSHGPAAGPQTNSERLDSCTEQRRVEESGAVYQPFVGQATDA